MYGELNQLPSSSADSDGSGDRAGSFCCCCYCMQRRNSGWGSVILLLLVGAAVGCLGTLAVLYIGDSGAGHAVLPPGNGTASGNSTGCEARADALIIIQEPAKVRAEQTWCGKHHFGLKEATSICLHERTALSLQCSLCFGGETLCGKTKCLSNFPLT